MHRNVETLLEKLRGRHVALRCDDVPDVVGQPTIRKRDKRATLEEDNLAVFTQPSGTGRTGGPPATPPTMRMRCLLPGIGVPPEKDRGHRASSWYPPMYRERLSSPVCRADLASPSPTTPQRHALGIMPPQDTFALLDFSGHDGRFPAPSAPCPSHLNVVLGRALHIVVFEVPSWTTMHIKRSGTSFCLPFSLGEQVTPSSLGMDLLLRKVLARGEGG